MLFVTPLPLTRALLLVAAWSSAVRAYNVDTRFPMIFSELPESYFGYSTAFHQNGAEKWLLVGAPRANRTNVRELKEPGVLYRCRIPFGKCEDVRIDDKGNTVGVYDGTHYYEKKDESWLGVSLDVRSDGLIVTCGHRWTNQYAYNNLSTASAIHDYYTNGICYTMNKDFNPNSIRMLGPLIERANQVRSKIANYAFGMAGIAAHFPEGFGADLLLGAPGTYNWDGKIINIEKADRYGGVSVWGVPSSADNLDRFMYVGYAVSSGRFTRDGKISYLLGAPRYQYIGKVYMVNVRNSRIEHVKFSKLGYQLGEYFGAALCGTDINNDDLDDLIIGAPLHANVREEGKVYIFMNHENIGILPKPYELKGSNIPGARFGAAISCIGDINQDDIKDVAIGAPYENDKGAVYLYYGRREEPYLDSQFMQRIEARNFPGENLRGFGISISKSLDVDRNNYPDIAIGSYSSGNAVVLRSHPVVQLFGGLIITPTKVSISLTPPECEYQGTPSRCFKVRSCVGYNTAVDEFRDLRVNTKLTIDAFQQVENPRGNILVGQNRKSSVERELTFRRYENCSEHIVYLRKNIRNYFAPITVLLEFNISPIDTKTFCPHCPVLDPLSPTSVKQQVMFLKGCGDDELCESDLTLDAWIVYGSSILTVPELLIGVNRSVSINVTIYNKQDDAFLTELNITIPGWSRFMKPPSSCHDQVLGGKERFFICDIGNPLPSKKSASMRLTLDIQQIPSSSHHLNMVLLATTGSMESNDSLSDNTITFALPVHLRADITVYGTASDEYFHEISNSSEEYSLKYSHIYEVRNLGPSPLPTVLVKLQIPYRLKEKETNFLNITQVKSTDGSRSAYVGECRGANVWHFSGDGKPRDVLRVPDQVRRRKRDAETATNPGNHETLFCDTAVCQEIECDIYTFSANESVTIEVEMMLFPNELHDLKSKTEAVDFVTEAHAYIISQQPNVQPPNHKPDSAKVKTVFDTGKKLESSLPDWIIPVSIICGVIVLAIIFAICYKIGFFKRKQRDELNELKRQSQGLPSPTKESEEVYKSNNQLIDSAENRPTDEEKTEK